MVICKYGGTGREQLRTILASPNLKHVRSAWEGCPDLLLLSLEIGWPVLSSGFLIWKTVMAAVPFWGSMMWNAQFTGSAAGVQQVLKNHSLWVLTSGCFSVFLWDWLPLGKPKSFRGSWCLQGEPRWFCEAFGALYLSLLTSLASPLTPCSSCVVSFLPCPQLLTPSCPETACIASLHGFPFCFCSFRTSSGLS